MPKPSNKLKSVRLGKRKRASLVKVVLRIFLICVMFMVITQFPMLERQTSNNTNIQNNDMPKDISSVTKKRREQRKISPPPPPPNQQFTSHWCHSRDLLPNNSRRASCLFHHMCIVQRPPNSPHDTNKKHEIEFLYVYDDAKGDSTKRKNKDRIKQRIQKGDASFTLGIGPHSGDERVVFSPVPMGMNELNSQYPMRNYVNGTSVLYYEYNSENFGHLLTDVLLPIYVALQGFGLEHHRDITIFRYSIMDAIGWSCDFHRRKLEPTGGVSRRWGNVGKHCDRFYGMTPQLMGGAPLHVLNGTTVQPTCFQNLVVGMPMYSDDCDEGGHGRETNIWSLCNHARQGQFWQFRNYLLQNVLGNDGIDAENDMPTHHKITITNRNDDVRGLKNLDQLISKLQKYYGSNNDKVELVVVEWETLSLKDQLDLIRTTTVHITPPGGVSFIALFLPRWATSIRLYSQEFLLDWHIYHYLGYISVEHVDCNEDRKTNIIPLEETMELVEEGLKRYDEYRVGSSGDASSSWTPLVFPSEGTAFIDMDKAVKEPIARSLAVLPKTPTPRDKGTSIPHTVYQSWISRDMAPSMTANIKKWKTMNGDYDFVFYDDNEQRNWMETNCTKYWPAWNDMELPAARADLFRYCLLYVNGGVWSDIDIEPKRPLQDFLSSSNMDLVVVHDGGMPGDEFLYNAFMAAVPGHPVFQRAMDIVMEHYNIRLQEIAVKCTGPHVLWRAVNDTLSGQVQPKSFVGVDEKHLLEYLYFDGKSIVSADYVVLVGKYIGYLDDAKLHGGEPHYGREVTWSTK